MDLTDRYAGMNGDYEDYPRDWQAEIDRLRAEIGRWKAKAKSNERRSRELRTENAKLRERVAEVEHWFHGYQTPEESIASLVESNKQLREVVEAVEWVEMFCPWCQEYEEDGHASDCKRQRALSLTPKG